MVRRIAVIVLWAAACGGQRGERQPGEIADHEIDLTSVGFQTPESVLHDPAADVYLVSNINGAPLAKDDNGFISRVSPNGKILALKWIDGASEAVTLNGPKGMTLHGDTLFVADIDVVRLFDRVSGTPLGQRGIPGATFLNDMTVGPDDRVYVTDTGMDASFQPTGTDAVWRFDVRGRPEALARGPALGNPNGIVAAGERLLVVSYGSGDVTFVNTETGQIQAAPSPPKGQLDGVVRASDGSYLMSSWEGQAVYRMLGTGQYEVAVDSVPAPADIGYDQLRRRLLIPLFNANEVKIVPMK